MRRGLWAAILAALAAGCGSETSTGQGETSSSTTQADSSSEAGSSSESTGSGPALAHADGIRVNYVEVNQGVGVRVGDNGKGVDPVDRTAFLLANRIALVRAFWRVDDDFEPRDIEAHLHLTFGDGTTDTRVDTKFVEVDSFVGNLNETFFWGLMADETQPGMTYSVELFETEPAGEDYVAPAPLPRLPRDGTEAFVGIESSYLIMKVVLIPFHYDDGGNCNTEPDTSDETMQLFQDLLFMMNPLDTLEFELHEPIEWNEPLSSFGELNSYMSNLRFEEGALPETYYYGLVDVCAGGLGDAGGQAHGIPADPESMDSAYQRVSSGLWIDPDWSGETFVHEVGHSQGRRHVACNGEEGGPDPTYPIPGGDVGEWGFGVIDFQLRHPTVNKDYMTYCHPTWVSTWGWNKVFPTIFALSMWDDGFPGNGGVHPGGQYTGSLLVGTILPSGKELWQTVPGGIDSSELDDGTEIEFAIADQVVARSSTRVQALPDGAGDVMIVAPLPEGFDAVSRLTRISGGKRVEIDRSAMRLAHHARTIRAR